MAHLKDLYKGGTLTTLRYGPIMKTPFHYIILKRGHFDGTEETRSIFLGLLMDTFVSSHDVTMFLA